MSDKELLSAISDIVEAKLEPIKQDIHGLKEDVSGLKEEVGSLKEDVSGLKEKVGNVEEEVNSLKEEVRHNSILLENEVLPRVRTIEKMYVDSSRMFMEKAVQIDGMQDDIDTMKIVI